jgi:hypothetical protein
MGVRVPRIPPQGRGGGFKRAAVKAESRAFTSVDTGLTLVQLKGRFATLMPGTVARARTEPSHGSRCFHAD